MVVIASARKGAAAMTMALAHSRGLLDGDERVSTCWPECAQQGMAETAIRRPLLSHQAGLFALREHMDLETGRTLTSWRLCRRERPAWRVSERLEVFQDLW